MMSHEMQCKHLKVPVCLILLDSLNLIKGKTFCLPLLLMSFQIDVRT